MFPTDLKSIYQRIEQIDPMAYAQTRNYVDGKVTRLSPYISRGVISTKQVAESLFQKGYDLNQLTSILQELAWRDYFQLVWIEKGGQLNDDLKHPQSPVSAYGIPTSVLEAKSGIFAIDDAISVLYDTGYMHNHLRMYTAAIVCNLANSHWKNPSQWMYYYILDGDWASNTCSWQWVAGSFSSKKYVANQENINRYSYTTQHGTFLDCPYENLFDHGTPEVLMENKEFVFKSYLPEFQHVELDSSLPTFIYNYYNLDPLWHKQEVGNRVLLLEPSHFQSYPIGEKPMQFMLDLAKNIDGIQVFVGEFFELNNQVLPDKIFFKEHPTAQHYSGICESRDWMFPQVRGYFPSFFAFWKQCQKYLKQYHISIAV